MNPHQQDLVDLCMRVRRETDAQARVVMHARATATTAFGIDLHAVVLMDSLRWMAATETNPRHIAWGSRVEDAIGGVYGPEHSPIVEDAHGLTLMVPCGPRVEDRVYVTPLGSGFFAYEHGRSHAGAFRETPRAALARVLDDEGVLLRAD